MWMVGGWTCGMVILSTPHPTECLAFPTVSLLFLFCFLYPSLTLRPFPYVYTKYISLSPPFPDVSPSKGFRTPRRMSSEHPRCSMSLMSSHVTDVQCPIDVQCPLSNVLCPKCPICNFRCTISAIRCVRCSVFDVQCQMSSIRYLCCPIYYVSGVLCPMPDIHSLMSNVRCPRSDARHKMCLVFPSPVSIVRYPMFDVSDVPFPMSDAGADAFRGARAEGRPRRDPPNDRPWLRG